MEIKNSHIAMPHINSLSRAVLCAFIFSLAMIFTSMGGANNVRAETLDSLVEPFAATPKSRPKKNANAQPNNNEAGGLIHLAPELAIKLTGHPSLDEARAKICSARHQIGVNRAQYWPQINFALTGGNKLTNKTTRADEFGGSDSPEYDGDGLNATLSVRQKIYDWGSTGARVQMARLERQRAFLERLKVLDNQTAGLLRAALEYVSRDTAVALMQAELATLEKTILSAEARFKAGAGRLSEMREAQIVRLENQSAIDMAAQRRRQSQQVLKAEFGITPEQARQFVDEFLAKRALNPETVPPEATIDGRIIGLDIRIASFEYKNLRAQKRPKIDGVLTGRAWDVTEKNQCGDTIYRGDPDYADARSRGFGVRGRSRYTNCHSHEITGAVELNMPIFDGGANKAQRDDIQARRRGLEARRLAHARTHESESAFLRAQMQEYINRLADMRAQTEKMQGQLDSLMALQGKSQNNPVAVARVQSRLLQSRAEVVVLSYQIESIRLELLLRANALAATLGIEPQSTGC